MYTLIIFISLSGIEMPVKSFRTASADICQTAGEISVEKMQEEKMLPNVSFKCKAVR